MLGNFSYFCYHLLTFFHFFFQKNSFRNTIRVSNNLDLDQDRYSVGPDLGPNCLQRLSADDKKLPLASHELIIFISTRSFPLPIPYIISLGKFEGVEECCDTVETLYDFFRCTLRYAHTQTSNNLLNIVHTVRDDH